MKSITYAELIKTIRQELTSQSELSSEFVKNAASTFGATLDRRQSDEIFESLKQSDNMMLFLIEKRNSNNNVSQTIDDRLLNSQSYDVKVIVYGNDSMTIVSKCAARFRKENVRQKLQAKGIYLSNVSEQESIYEFKGLTTWLRNDVTLTVCCEHDFSSIEEDLDFDELNTLNIIRR